MRLRRNEAWNGRWSGLGRRWARKRAQTRSGKACRGGSIGLRGRGRSVTVAGSVWASWDVAGVGRGRERGRGRRVAWYGTPVCVGGVGNILYMLMPTKNCMASALHYWDVGEFQTFPDLVADPTYPCSNPKRHAQEHPQHPRPTPATSQHLRPTPATSQTDPATVPDLPRPRCRPHLPL